MADQMLEPFLFGDWLVEPDQNRLTRGGTARLLEPKAMEVLVYLCARPGRVVGADEIIKAVWDDRPMGDNPVYKSVAKLRRALGDDSSEPRYIATIPKKGYRLLAEVAVAPQRDVAQGVTAASAPLLRKSLPILSGILIGIVLAVAVFWRPLPDPPILRSVSDFSGSHSQPSFAPDGEAIAFVNEVDGGAHVWILDSDQHAPRPLTSGEQADSRPRWSPDGRTILFVRGGNLWSVPAAGGEAMEIVRNAINPNWSRDGARIVFERRYQVWVANADGGQQQRITGVPQRELALSPRWPAFSPDGREIVFLDADATPLADLWRVPVDGGEPTQLTFNPAFGSAPVWSQNEKYIYYSTLRGGSRTLWRVDVADNSTRAMLTGSGDDDFPDISADGRRLIYSNSRERFTIMLTDPDTGKERMLHESRQMILAPELSPDRETLAYFALSRGGGVQVFTLPVEGGTPTQVTSDPLVTHAIPRWSADGQTLYFYQSGPITAFSKVGATGGESTTMVDGWDWNVAHAASVAPDGAAVIYSRLTGQVPVQTLIRDLRSKTDRSFYATLEYPRWSADGANVIGALHSDQRFPGDVALCPVAGSKCRIVARDARIPMFSADESQIFYVRGFGSSQVLFATASDGNSVERELMTMAPLFDLGPFYDVTNSGAIVWVRYEEEPSAIWLSELPVD